MIINTDKDDAIFRKQLTCQKEARIHHRQPRRVVAAARIRIAGLEIAFGISLSGQLEVSIQRLCVVIRIDEVATSVVRWINIYSFDAAEIGFIEEFKNF